MGTLIITIKTIIYIHAINLFILKPFTVGGGLLVVQHQRLPRFQFL